MTDVIVIDNEVMSVITESDGTVLVITEQVNQLIVADAQDVVLDDVVVTEIIKTPADVVVVDKESITIITEGMQGPQGPTGPVGPAAAADAVYTAGVALGGHRIVYVDDAGLLQYATNANIALVWRALGMTTGAISAGAAGPVRLSGEITEPSWTLTPGAPVYLGENGLITQVVPALPVSKFLQVVGVALTSTSIVLEKRDPIQF